jgi:hypothetical protein
VAAVEMTPRRALPKQVVQLMHADLVVPEKAEKEWVHAAKIIHNQALSCKKMRILCKISAIGEFIRHEMVA